MTKHRKSPILSLLLVIALIFSMLPTAALAAEPDTEPHICTDESCTEHEHEEHTHNEEHGELEWILDHAGVLHIGGYGSIAPFTSADDQPWRYQRDEITAVMFDYPNQPEIENTDYWFDDCPNLDPENIYDIEMCEMMSGISLLSAIQCGVWACTCFGPCIWEYRDYQAMENSELYHTMVKYCATCGKTDGVRITGSHTFWNNTCTLCGYTRECPHFSTSLTWVSSCDWEKYCDTCGEILDSGVTHGPFSYDEWEYFNPINHRSYSTCNKCGEGLYVYLAHTVTLRYDNTNSTQHQKYSYCHVCSSTIGPVVDENHIFSYGRWTNYNETQHRRTKSCFACGYSELEYGDHLLSYSGWTTTDTQHSRTASCSCGYTKTETVNHSFTYGSLENFSDTQHRQSKTCLACGYSGYDYAPHTLIEGNWQYSSDEQHRRVNTCICGYSSEEYENHTDIDGNDQCDFCGYLMTRFSVTIPANLSLTVSKNGQVFAATTAQIVNSSSDAVKVSAITLTANNGWSIVPYSTNMANAKVNAKRIGFKLNGAVSRNSGSTENLILNSNWSIAKDTALPLNYDAVVSAASRPINDQALTVVFVVGWNSK